MNLVTCALLGESNRMGECLMLLLVRTVPSAWKWLLLEADKAGSGLGRMRRMKGLSSVDTRGND